MVKYPSFSPLTVFALLVSSFTGVSLPFLGAHQPHVVR